MIIWMQQVGMQILLWLLGAVDSVFAVFAATAGLTKVDADGQSQTLTEYFLSLNGVQKAFWIVIIASVAICAVCTIVAVVKNIINTKGGEQKSHARTLGQSLSTIFVTLFMAMFMTVGIGAAETLLRTVNAEINDGKEQIMSHQIIDVSLGESYMFDSENVQGLNEPDGDGGWSFVAYVYFYETVDGVGFGDPTKWIFESKLPTPKTYDDPGYEGCIIYLKSDGTRFEDPKEIYTATGETDENGNPVYELNTAQLTPVQLASGWINGNSAETLKSNILDESYRTILGSHRGAIVPTHWKYNGKINPDSFNFLIGFLCAIIILIALLSATLGLVKRLFDIVILFIVLPGITATIPLDNGAKFKLWRETVISKIFLAFGSVLAVNVFFIVAPTLWNVTIPGASTFVNSLLKVMLICGGALTISGGQLLFARLLGTSAEESREMGQSARTLFGGAMTGIGAAKAVGRGLFGYRNANGQRVGGILKGGASALGTLGGGAVNAVGGALGGQAYKASKFAQKSSAVSQALRGFGSSSGWFGGGSKDNPNLGYGLSRAGGALVGKFAGSKTAQKSGLINGLSGAIRAPIDKRHAAARDNARSMIAAGNATLGNAYGAAAASEAAKLKALPRDDFGRDVMPGFEGGVESNLPEIVTHAKNDGTLLTPPNPRPDVNDDGTY